MNHALVLTFDPQAEARVESVWTLFEKAGIGKTPGQFGEVPHVTLSEGLQGDSDLLQTIPETGVSDYVIRLVPFGLFLGEKHVLYYHAVLPPEMRAMHSLHHQLLRERHIQNNRLYTPMEVIFHCTVAVDIDHADLQRAVSIMADWRETILAHARQMELWKYFPVSRAHVRTLEEAGGRT